MQDEENPLFRELSNQPAHAKEPEVSLTLCVAVKPESHVLLGDALTVLANKIGLTNEELVALQNIRDKTPAEPLSFD